MTEQLSRAQHMVVLFLVFLFFKTKIFLEYRCFSVSQVMLVVKNSPAG